MKLKETEFYHALCWAIKKYAPGYKKPDGNDDIYYALAHENNVDRMTTWSETSEGQSYWEDIHNIFYKKYMSKLSDRYYFKKMVEDYKKHANPQLEFDL